MNWRADITLILDRVRPSKQLTSTQVLCQFVALSGGTLQPINISKALTAGQTGQFIFKAEFTLIYLSATNIFFMSVLFHTLSAFA